MDLDDRDLGAILIGVLLEGEQPWLVLLDEIDQAQRSPLLILVAFPA
jgi:hypothetical protein